MTSISTLLVANRGEVARRIFRTCRELGISTVAVFSEADRNAPFVLEADIAIPIGPAPAAESYLRGDAIIEAAKAASADAIHPGYGFLAENASFASSVRAAGLIFVGPSAESIESMGLKHHARELAEKNQVPVVPGVKLPTEGALEAAQLWCAEHGFPALLKASAGGGGKGMRRVDSAEDLQAALSAAQGEAARAFGNSEMLIEQYLERSRHVEVQVLGDQQGRAIALGARDCSVQRRHQKLIEETPPPNLPSLLVNEIIEAALRLCGAAVYEGAGTVEFIVGKKNNKWVFYFLEMNTRLQVEHPVTEVCYGIDLVAAQLQIAQGAPIESIVFEPSELIAMEARVCAEDHEFLPQTGELVAWETPNQPSHSSQGVRIDSGVEVGSVVSPFYDSMLAKVIAFGRTRDEARMRLRGALKSLFVAGVQTNIETLLGVLEHADFCSGDVHTELLSTEFLSTGLAQPEFNPFEYVLCAILAENSSENDEKWPLRFSNMPTMGVWETWKIDDQTIEARQSRGSRRELEFKSGPIVSVSHVQQRDQNLVSCTFTSGDQTRVLRAQVVWHGDEATVKIAGHTKVLSRTPRFSTGISRATGDEISAPMPGRVLSVQVSIGDTVKAGESLVVLEAMKMEQRLCAPRDIVIKSVDCAADDQVDAGQVLVRFESLPADQ